MVYRFTLYFSECLSRTRVLCIFQLAMQQEDIIIFLELCFAPKPGEVTAKLCFGDKQKVYGMPMAGLCARPIRNKRIWEWERRALSDKYWWSLLLDYALFSFNMKFEHTKYLVCHSSLLFSRILYIL